MIAPSAGAKVYLACGATDMRKGFGGLYGAVKTVLEQDPLSGQWFVFCNGRKTTLKVFYWDGSGFWVCAKRLSRGVYSWPAEGKTTMTMDEFYCLVAGIELSENSYKKWHRVAR